MADFPENLTAPPSPGREPPAPSVPGRESPDASLARARNIVEEIRLRMADLARREAELQRRSDALDRQVEDFRERGQRAAAGELEQLQHRLEVRSAELNAEAVELAARRARLAQYEQKVAERESRLTQERAELETQLAAHHAQLEQEQQRREQERQSLLRRVGVIRKREDELQRRIQLARDQIVAERNVVEQQRAELASATIEAERRREQLQQEFERLRDQHAELDRRAVESDQTRARLTAEQAEIDGRRTLLQQRARELDQRDVALTRRQRVLQERWAAARQERQQREQALEGEKLTLAKQADELARQTEAMREKWSELRDEERRIDDRRQQLAGELAALETERLRIRESESELERRRAEVEDLRGRAAALERTAQEHRDAAAALREQIETRDADSRQAALALELERQQIDSDRAGIERQIRELDALRTTREAEFDATRAAIARQIQRLHKAERSLTAMPRRWWIRNLVLSGAAAGAAAAIWLGAERPRYRASAELRIITENPNLADANGRHRAALLDPNLLAGAGESDTLADSWRARSRSGAVDADAADDRTAIVLSAVDFDPTAARRLVATAARAYAAQVNAVPADENLPEDYRDIGAWRANLAIELNDQEQQAELLRTTIRTLPAAEDQQAAIAALAALRAEHARVVRSLSEERSHLAALVAEELPTGRVDAVVEDALLDQDAIYQEDLNEFRTAALQYRTELGVALLLLVDPLKETQKALRKLSDVLDEQRALSPPPPVVAVIEQFSGECQRIGPFLADFAGQWQARFEAVQHMDVEKDVVEAVRRQSEAAEAARGLSDELKKLVGVLAARIDELANQSAGGTREVVVAAVLRSEVSSLTAAVNKSVEAATATDASENFRLETHDRQLRGLRTRLAQRRDAVHQQLQLEADRVARQKLMQERDASRDRVRALEQQRDELTGALMARADDLRIIDQDVLKRSRAEAQLNELGARGAWLRTRIQQLDEKLALLRRRGPKPDRIELGDTALLLLTPDRYAHAAAAAGVACVATALVGFLMVARNPLRRRHRELIAWVGSPAGRQFQPEPIPRP